MTTPDQAADVLSASVTTTTKSMLRSQLLARRGGLTQLKKETAEATIRQRVVERCNSILPMVMGVYWAIQNEPDLQQAYLDLARRGMQLALPVVTARDAPLQFARWTPGDAMSVDAFGVPTPTSRVWVQPQLLLVPCLGFNNTRIRLGYGGGFYDRTLTATPRPLAIGISYACALAEFEPEPHDIALDQIITEDASW